MVVEGVEEGAVHAFEGMCLAGIPGNLVRDWNDGRAKRPHSVELGLRRSLDRHDRAWNAKRASRISDGLTGVAGADGPDAARPFLVAEACHRVGRAANFISVG